MIKRLVISAAGAALAFPVPALAHPGHGSGDGQSPLHYITEPLHGPLTLGAAAATLALLTLTLLALARYRHRRSRR